MRRAWTPLFEDEELDRDRNRRHPVAPAQASKSARRKKETHLTPDGLPVHSYRTLLDHLATGAFVTLAWSLAIRSGRRFTK